LSLKSRAVVWFYAPAALIVVVDQLTKLAARSALGDGRTVTVIPGFLDLKLSFNSGAAFGALPNWAPLFVVAALAAIYAIVRIRRSADGSRVLSFGLGLILGGAVGNLIDRLLLPGRAVTDFLSLHVTIKGMIRSWPTFNIADAAIVAGAVLTMIYVYMIDRRRQEASDA